MKAITRYTYGNSEILGVENIERPIPNDDEVLVRVHCTTVNRTDCGILTGQPFLIRFFTGLTKPRSPVPGTDFAGKVKSVGKNVVKFKPGDRVWGLNDEGLASQAEYMTIKENKAVIHAPEGFTYEEVVACAEGAHYAYNFANKVKLKEGDKVLINGATGAIGSSALQILKARGVYVTAVGNTKNLDLLRSLAADKVYDYEKEDFTAIDEERYHFVFDAVGKSRYRHCKKLLLPGGKYISSELGPHAENLYLPLLTKFTGRKGVIFPIPVHCKRSLLYIKELMEKGRFKAVIDRYYQPEEVREAYRYVMSGKKTGNVILRFDENL